MASGGVPLAPLAAAGIGALFLWSGLKGAKISTGARSLLAGQQPSGANVNPITTSALPFTEPAGITRGQGYGAGGGGGQAGNRALGKLMAGAYGWAGGQEWQALDYGWGTLESGWNNRIYNGGQVGGPYQPGKAYGIPQALGHGPNGAPYPAGNLANPPGAGGISSAVAQIAWGLAYIKAKYGRPSAVPGWLGQGGYGGY